MNDELRKNIINRKRRYIVGSIYFFIFLICQFTTNLYYHFEDNNFKAPFSYAYVSVVSMTFILIFYIINEKMNKAKRKDKIMNIYYHNYNYFYNKRQNKSLAIKDLETFLYKSEADFNKNFHKICITLMILLFSYICFKMKGLDHLKVKSENSILIITSLITVRILRIFLIGYKEIKFLNILAFLINCSGICLIIFYQIPIYFTESLFSDCTIYSIIAGVCFAFLVCLTELYNRQYGINFKLTLVYGFVGLYGLILIPLLLFIVYVFDLESNFLDCKSIYYLLLSILVNSIIRNLTAVYSIIYLSPIVFIFGLTLTLPLSILFDIIQGDIDWELNYFFISGFALLIIGFLIHYINRFKILNKQIKNEEEKSLLNDNEEVNLESN